MITNWIQLWQRHLLRFKLYTFINIAGLSLGISAAAAIYIYILDELTYDRFHEKGDRIYRVNTVTHFDGNEDSYFTTSAPLGEIAKSNIEGLDEVARLFARQASIQLMDSKTHALTPEKFREDHFFLSDPSIFKIFSSRFLGAYGLYIVSGVAIIALVMILWGFFRRDPNDGVGVKLN